MMALTISHEQTYVALAKVLPPNLRVHASAANLCFFEIVDHATDVERLFVRVAALPHRLNEANSPRVFTTYLSVEQLTKAMPWDRAMQARPTCDVRELVELHAQQMQGVLPERVPTSVLALSAQAPQEEITLMPLPEIFVSCETVQEVAEAVQAPRAQTSQRQKQAWARLNWFRAAIAVLRRQLSHISQVQHTLFTSLAHLDTELRRAYVAQHRLHQSLINACPVYIGERQVGWHVVVGVPVSPARAA